VKYIIIILFLALPLKAVDLKKNEMSLDNVVNEINHEKELKNKEFVNLVTAKKETEVIKALKADKDYALVNLEINKEPVLIYCIKNKMWKAAEVLIKGGSNLNAKDENGKVALMYAAEAKNKYVATMLIASKADKQIKDGSGITAQEYLKKNGLE
jgi:ankyrin repeat protein